MVDSGEKPERIKEDVLEKLDKIKINRKKSYSNRIDLLLEYCNLEKKKFNSWVRQKEEKDGKK